MSTIDRMISGIGANIDQSAANNEALHKILSELRRANQSHKTIEDSAFWCAILAKLTIFVFAFAIIPPIFMAVLWVIVAISIYS